MTLLREWKTLVAFARQHLDRPRLNYRTIRRWHYERMKIPFSKSSNSIQGRVIIDTTTFIKWLDIVLTIPRKTHLP